MMLSSKFILWIILQQIIIMQAKKIKKLSATSGDCVTISQPMSAFQPADPMVLISNVNHPLDCTLLCVRHEPCVSISYLVAEKLCLLSRAVLSSSEIKVWDNTLFSSVHIRLMNEDGFSGPTATILSQGQAPALCGASSVNHRLQPSGRPKRIVDGWTPEPYRAPWVGILIKNDRARCTGFIISKNMADKSSIWALSAKHCLVNDLSNDDSDRKIDLTHFGFLFGVHDLRFATQYAVYRTIAEIFLHSDQGTKLNDLALIKLAKQVKFNSYINGLCLPDSSEKVESYNSASCVTCGFGATKVGGTSPVGSKIIQCINFEAQPLDSDRGLSSRDGNSMVKLKAKAFGPYFGDSGSPIFCRTKHPWLFLFAVVIGGQSIVFKRAYVMAARISYFMNYIDENMNGYNGCLHPCLVKR